MKLLRYGPTDQERPGLLDADGQLRDLGTLTDDIGGKTLPGLIALLGRVDPASLPLVAGTPRLGPPVAGVGKIVCVGLNYADHARESGAAVPPEPVLFLKATSSITGPNDPVIIPRGSRKTDWEVELGVVIGRQASYVSEADALAHVAGYVLVNDVSEREYQLERHGQWDKGKGCDSFSPIGPWLVTPDELPDPHTLDLWLDVNGRRMQDSNTAQLIYRIPFLIHYISQFMTLKPGDIISTGTPAGVGLGQKPEPWYLKAGDVMELGVQGLGRQRQVCVPRG